MTCRNGLVVCAVTFVVLLTRSGRADAQAHSFDEIVQLGLLKPGDRIDLRGPVGQAASGVFREFRDGALVLFEPDRGRDATFTEAEVQRIRRSGGHATAWGTAIGAGAAMSVTYWAAASYGENEGGRFCGGCFLQWGAASIPAGTAIGAGVGFAIERARRRTVFVAASRRTSIATQPLFVRRGAGILMTASF